MRVIGQHSACAKLHPGQELHTACKYSIPWGVWPSQRKQRIITKYMDAENNTVYWNQVTAETYRIIHIDVGAAFICPTLLLDYYTAPIWLLFVPLYCWTTTRHLSGFYLSHSTAGLQHCTYLASICPTLLLDYGAPPIPSIFCPTSIFNITCRYPLLTQYNSLLCNFSYPWSFFPALPLEYWAPLPIPAIFCPTLNFGLLNLTYTYIFTGQVIGHQSIAGLLNLT